MNNNKKYPLIQARFQGIKCDNDKCGWKDMSVKQEEYPDWIDKPCPCCGENLLTRECYEEGLLQLEATENLNNFLNSLFPDELKEKLIKTDYYKAKGTIDRNGHITDFQKMGPTTLEAFEEEYGQ